MRSEWVIDIVGIGRQAFEDLAFHIVFRSIYDFISVEVSAIYFDVLKTRLYCAPRNSRSRRSAQTSLYRITSALARILAPILVFTAEEICSLPTLP